MKYRALGRSGLDVSCVALGLWQAGDVAGWGSDFDERDAIATIHAAPDVGLTLLDTAPAYGHGASERLVGKAIAGRRDQYVVATKVSTDEITRDQVRAAVHASLGRLGTDTIDLIQIHWPNTKGEPFDETLAALEELRHEGKVRVLGVSNFNAAQLADCLETTRIDSLQPPYNLLWRHVEEEILPFCRQHHLGTICYSPLAQGLLTGKYTRANRPADSHRPRNLLWHGACFDVAMQVVDVLRRIAAEHDCTPGQAALAWLLHQPGVTSVIAGAKRPDQLRENALAAHVELNEGELKELADASEPLRAMTAGEFKMWFTPQAGEYDVR